MPYVPPEVKERIKREISVQRLAEARGIKLVRSGKELIGLCPFHDDRNPSLNIDPVKNVWHCKGACGEGGDVIQWVMRAQGVSFTHAVELLKREHFPLAAEPAVKKSAVCKLPPLIDATADDKKLLGTVVDYYSRTLKQSPEAMRYLVKRGLQSSEIIDRFKLGYANRTLCLHLPASNRAAGDAQRERLKQLGILRNQKPGHEHFNGSLVIPVFNLAGEVVEMYGRKIVPNLRPGTDYHTYLPGPHRGVWNEEVLIASKDVILCEALIDAMTFWVAGYRQVTASYGVNGFTQDHRAAFARHGTERVYIAYDRDEAGDKAAAKLGEELIGMGIECFRVQFPKGMDANEYALKTQPAAKALGVLLTGAAWLGKGSRPTVRVPAPVVVPEPIAAAPAIEPLPAENRSTAKEKKIEEPMPESAAEPTPEPEQQPERDFSLAVDAVPSEPVVLPMPMAEPAGLKIEIDGEEVRATANSGRVYRVLGLDKCTTRGAMRVNVKVSGHNVRGEFCCHGDTLDIEAFRQRAMFVKQTAQELATKEDMIHREVGQLWSVLGDLQRERIKQTLAPAEEKPVMDAQEEAAAMALLRDPRLLDRVLKDFERCGVVGEETNKTVSYVAAVSRLLPKPLAIVVQSSSSAGKSSLMEAVLEFMPEEHRESYTAMTGQALFYMGQKNLKHKILAVSEEEGASRAAYALKLLQSEGKLNIASTGKDPVTGKHVTHEYVVEGPVMIFLTTTAQDVDEELLNRCIVLTVNEEQEQTRAIHRKQREAQTREGLWMREERMDILKLHRNAQRLLKPVHVVIEHLKDQGFPDAMTRTRRDHMKFLTLIQAVTLLHQHQRETKQETRHDRTLEYIEATEADVELARQLCAQVLGPSLDELPPHTRRLLMAIDAMVRQECEHLQVERSEYRFTRRVVRQHTRWGDTQLRVHLRRLEEMEYLAIHRGAPGQAFVYQLCFDAESGSYDADRAGENIHCAGSARAGSGEMAGGAPGNESPASMRVKDAFSVNHGKHRSEADAANVLPVVVVPVSKPNGHGLHMEVK
jgi:DNA primase catalytic core